MPAPLWPLREDPDMLPILQKGAALAGSVSPSYTWLDVQEHVGKAEVWNLVRHPKVEKLYHDTFIPLVKQKYGLASAFVTFRIELPLLDTTGFFKSDTPPELWRAQLNSWPYALPKNVSHTLVWTRLGLLDQTLATSAEEWAIVQQRGITGLTGAIPASLKNKGWLGLADTTVGREIRKFVCDHWPEEIYDTVFFVNPPPYQSIKDLAHFHVMAQERNP